jgi:hypothetical protein
MQAITAMRALADRNADTSHLLALRMHRIGPPRDELHQHGSPSERSRAWLQLLQGEGRIAGKRFLSAHGADIGVRETLDVAKAYSDGHKPKMRVPVKEEPQDVEKLPLPANAQARLPRIAESGDRHKTGVVPAKAGTQRRSSKDTGFPLARE